MKKYVLLMGLGLLAASATAQTTLTSDLFGRNVNPYGWGRVWPTNVSAEPVMAALPVAASGVSSSAVPATAVQPASGQPLKENEQSEERRYFFLPTSLDWLTLRAELRTTAAPSRSSVVTPHDVFQWLAEAMLGKGFGAPGTSLSAETVSAVSMATPATRNGTALEAPKPSKTGLAADGRLFDFELLGITGHGLKFHDQASSNPGATGWLTQPIFQIAMLPDSALPVLATPVANIAGTPVVASMTASLDLKRRLDFQRLGFEQPGFEQFNWPGAAASPESNPISEVRTSPELQLRAVTTAAEAPQDFPQTMPSTSLFSPLPLLAVRFDSEDGAQEPEIADSAAILTASSLLPAARVDYFTLACDREGESRVAMEAPAELRLALSATRGARAISQQEPSQTQSGQPSDQPNPPTNPLQTGEPPKPTDTTTTKAKATFSGGESSNAGKDQLLGELRLMQRYSQIHGDETRSFRVPGSNRLGEFNIFTDNAFRFTRRLQTLFMYRGTDDRSIDPEHNSLQKAYLRFYGPRDETILGDSLVNYSRLTFNQNIKGLNFSTRLGDHWKLFAVGGVFIDRYGSLYKDLPGRPYLATVAGARLEYRFLKDSTLGMNFSNSTDQIGSLPLQSAVGNPTGVGIPPLPADNRVYSVDSKFQLGGLRTDVELAYSSTDFDRRFFAGCPGTCDSRMPLPGFGFQNDWGFRLEESYRYKKLNLRGSFVRYEPNFASINARQIADLQDMVFRAGYDVTDWLTVDGTVRRSNNNLKRQLPFETTLWGPEARFLFHDLSIYRRATLEVGYRHRDVQASDKSIDRFVRIPYAEFSIPVSTTFLTIGYERRNSVDMRDRAQSSNTDRVYASLRGIYDLGGWHITPTFRYELERQSHRPRINNLPRANCFLTPFNVNCLLDRDSNRLGLASVFIEPPKYFIAELAFRDTSATIFGPTGYSRPSYRAQLTYKIRNDENTEFIFGFERNSNFYFTSPDYDERIFSGTLLLKFGKRGQ